MIHALFINIVTDFIGVEFQVGNPLFWIPVLTVLVAALSLACAAFIRKIPKIGTFVA